MTLSTNLSADGVRLQCSNCSRGFSIFLAVLSNVLETYTEQGGNGEGEDDVIILFTLITNRVISRNLKLGVYRHMFGGVQKCAKLKLNNLK